MTVSGTESATVASNGKYKVSEGYLNFFNQPHTLSALGLLVAVFLYVAVYSHTSDTVSNVKWGLAAAGLTFIVIGLVQFGDGPFIRPHPSIWRVVLALSVLYQMLLVFILFQDRDDMRYLLHYLDPKLGVPLPEKSYAEDCSLSLPNLRKHMDVFVIAHTLGWLGKAIILRDYWFCWILSVMFEVMEYSLQHHLPNFAECWWDHWILDVLICNWLGTVLGMKICQYFEMKQYSWRGINEIPSYRGKVKRTMQQFTPHSWVKFHWGATKSLSNFVAVLGLLSIFLICEVNVFYLKYLLWISPEHWLVVIRLVLIFLMGIPGTREAYQFLSDRECKSFGPQAWLTVGCILTELAIIVKYGRGIFISPTPFHIKVLWALFVSALFLYATARFLLLPQLNAQARRRKHLHKAA